VFLTRERLVRYVQALVLARDAADRIPELTEPFRLPDKATVFHARTPRWATLSWPIVLSLGITRLADPCDAATHPLNLGAGRPTPGCRRVT
jgi:hypothetical protein